MPPQPSASPRDVELFETKIRPLLHDMCTNCHSGPEAAGKLDLRSRERVLEGGDRGPAIVPGDPEASLLIQAVRQTGKLKMPPRGKMTDDQIQLLEQWVRDGAVWGAPPHRRPSPSGKFPITPEQRKFWSYQPIRDPAPPKVAGAAHVTAIDRFLLAGLKEKGLKPNRWADRRTLIRRATFDLTGLPPTPEEVEAFLADGKPGAFARVVDRLLSSPRYGERWGRHWLDVARYSDSNGLDDNEPMYNAFRYRDYVIQAFNKDKPYNQFIREQLAGDLMGGRTPEEKYERIVATGFLALGPKVLREWDKAKLAIDVADEQIDVTTKAFMATSVTCARCHNHKFDPISQNDYYSLAGVFLSTTSHFVDRRHISRWLERPLAEVSTQEAGSRRKWEQGIRRLSEALAGANQVEPERRKKLEADLAELKAHEPPDVPMAIAVADGRVEDASINIRGVHTDLGPVVPRRFLTLFGGEKHPFTKQTSGRLELANWIASPNNPLTARVMVNRIWQGHFGRGIVGTPDYFGLMGEQPTNPELLDYLASRFIEGGWTVKKMHRLIMLSAAYQRSSAHNPVAYAKDPANLLLWRMNRRRLDAEALRDAMLVTEGKLDLTMGGPVIPRSLSTTNDESQPEVNYNVLRRSVYLPVIRTDVYEMFRIFDYVDPHLVSGSRTETAVAPQALFMLNSPFALDRSRGFAERLLSDTSMDDRARVERAYQLALARPPRSAETARALQYLDEFTALAASSGRGAGGPAAASAPKLQPVSARVPPSAPSAYGRWPTALSEVCKGEPPTQAVPAGGEPLPPGGAAVGGRPSAVVPTSAIVPPPAPLDPREQAWETFCQTLFAGAEFRYVD